MFNTGFGQSFSGVKITTSEECYTMVLIFPDRPKTKRRNRRIKGKYGRLDRMQPEAYKTPFGIVCHPKIYRKLQASL